MKHFSWEKVDWKLVNSRIRRLQERIYKASLSENLKKVNFLQNVLIHSLDAKLLSVRRVTLEKKISRLDKQISVSPSSRARLVQELKLDGIAYSSRIYIPKPGRVEERPLGIPIIKDRAKQSLVLMALEPQWEARFEPNSYGFRPGRTTHDAIEALFLAIRGASKKSSSERFIVEADLKGCFDNIDHNYLLAKLNTTPQIREQIKAWLQVGIFEGLSPEAEEPENPRGTPRRGIISPFLCNIVLHGIEQNLKEWIVKQTWPVSSRHLLFTANKIKSITLVRFVEDFIISHPNRDIAVAAKDETAHWLQSTSKLQFHEDQTTIKSTREGFNFLGFSFISINDSGSYRTKIYPSRKNKKRIIKKIGDLCRKNRSISAYELIGILRPIILGWANYFRYSECQSTFSTMDRQIFQILRAWTFRRDRRRGRISIKEKYFPSGREYYFDGRRYSNNWILVGETRQKGGISNKRFLPKISWVKSLKFVKVKGVSSIYDGNHLYWTMRLYKYGVFNIRVRKLIRAQNCLCAFCGTKFDHLSVMEVDHIIPRSMGGKDIYSNLQLLHKHCYVEKNQRDHLQI